MTRALATATRWIERVGLWAALLVLGVSVLVGYLASPGAGVLVTASAILVVVLVMGYAAIDSLLNESDAVPVAAGLEDGEVATLRREKDSVLQVLRDLEIERDLGKVSPGDFEALDSKFRGRAIDLMKRIDKDLAAFRKRAEGLIAERLASSGPTGAAAATGQTTCPSCGSPSGAHDLSCKKCGRRIACGSCGAPLDADSLFCKKCGAKVESNA